MRILKLQLIPSMISLGLLTATLQAQPAGRYLTGATLYLSTGDWTDIWLNGQQLVDQYPYPSVTRGYVTVRLERDQLCVFKKENVLALEITETVEPIIISDENRNDKVGIAYALELSFSDGGNLVLTSNDEGVHPFYAGKDKTDTDPLGWKDPGFDDSSWSRAELSKPPSEVTKILNHPKTHKTIQYLTAFGVKSLRAQTGERRLFRRKFPLDVVPGPGCPQPRVFPTATPKPKPTATPTWTFTPLPRPTATPTFIYTPRSWPTYTPTAVPIVRKPKPIPAIAIQRVRRIPTFTPTPILFIPADTPTPIRRLKAKPTLVLPIIPTASFTPGVLPVGAAPETIIFNNPPVNVLVSLKDGPGKYKVEIVNARENPVRILYDKEVAVEKETWLSWDGKNEEGKLQPYGHYSAVFSKDGKILRHIALEWITPDQ